MTKNQAWKIEHYTYLYCSFCNLQLLKHFSMRCLCMTVGLSAFLWVIWLIPLKAQHNFLRYAAALGGTGAEMAEVVFTTPQGQMYTAGHYEAESNSFIGNFKIEGRGFFVAGHGTKGEVNSLITSLPNPHEARIYSISAAFSNDGFLYVAGTFGGGTLKFTQVDSLINPSQIVPSPKHTNIFFARYLPNGTMQWMKQIQGTGLQTVGRLRVDFQGSIFICGRYTNNLSFIKEENGAFEELMIESAGDSDGYLVKFTDEGIPVWIHKAGGTGYDAMHDLDVDASGNVFVTGCFSDLAEFEFDELLADGKKDLFVVKYNAIGEVVWTQRGGGIQDDEAFGIVCNPIESHLYITGYYRGAANFGAQDIEGYIAPNMFLAKINLQTGLFEWVRQGENRLGSETNRYLSGKKVSTDANGNIYVTGWHESPGFIDGFWLKNNGGGNFFVAKYNPEGAVKWMKQGNSSNMAIANDIKVIANEVMVCGQLHGMVTLDFPFEETKIQETGNALQGDILLACWGTEDPVGILYAGAEGKSFGDIEVWYPRKLPGENDEVIFFMKSPALHTIGKGIKFGKLTIYRDAGVKIGKEASLLLKAVDNRGRLTVEGLLEVKGE
jgi:hypothetical protein